MIWGEFGFGGTLQWSVITGSEFHILLQLDRAKLAHQFVAAPSIPPYSRLARFSRAICIIMLLASSWVVPPAAQRPPPNAHRPARAKLPEQRVREFEGKRQDPSPY